jgi:hypothetical protein
MELQNDTGRIVLLYYAKSVNIIAGLPRMYYGYCSVDYIRFLISGEVLGCIASTESYV